MGLETVMVCSSVMEWGGTLLLLVIGIGFSRCLGYKFSTKTEDRSVSVWSTSILDKFPGVLLGLQVPRTSLQNVKLIPIISPNVNLGKTFKFWGLVCGICSPSKTLQGSSEIVVDSTEKDLTSGFVLNQRKHLELSTGFYSPCPD